MAPTISPASSNGQSAESDSPKSAKTASADFERWLALLRQAMTDTGWTVDALANLWKVDRGYVWCLVNGDKPWSVARLLSLPDDLEARFEELRCESFGRIVVPPVSEEEAQRHLAIGLFATLVRKSMAKADLPAKRMAKAAIR